MAEFDVLQAAERYYETRWIIDGDPELDLHERVPPELQAAVQLLAGHLFMNRAARERYAHLSSDNDESGRQSAA